MPNVDSEKQKEIIKEAIHEWLDCKYKEIGKWTFKGLLAMGFALLIYTYLKHFGIGK
jgi:hypothetical protein